MTNMQVLVCYDIKTDSRRAKLMKYLKNFLEHVQKSVFEGPLDGKRFQRMVDGIPAKIDMEEDAVRVYRFCKRCEPLTQVIGRGIEVKGKGEDRII